MERLRWAPKPRILIDRCLCLCLCVSCPCHMAKETYYKAKETYHMAKETYHMAKETYYEAKETYHMAKETVSFSIRLCRACRRARSLPLFSCVCGLFVTRFLPPSHSLTLSLPLHLSIYSSYPPITLFSQKHCDSTERNQNEPRPKRNKANLNPQP